MKKIAGDEWKRFVLSAAHTAKLATVRSDGRTHVVPVWFDLDGDQIVFTTGHDTVKGRAIRRDPRVCLCVDDETPPFAYVMVEGTASISADMSQLAYWARRIAARYMGEAAADAYGRRNAVEGELVVRVTPSRVIGVKDVAL